MLIKIKDPRRPNDFEKVLAERRYHKEQESHEMAEVMIPKEDYHDNRISAMPALRPADINLDESGEEAYLRRLRLSK